MQLNFCFICSTTSNHDPHRASKKVWSIIDTFSILKAGDTMWLFSLDIICRRAWIMSWNNIKLGFSIMMMNSSFVLTRSKIMTLGAFPCSRGNADKRKCQYLHQYTIEWWFVCPSVGIESVRNRLEWTSFQMLCNPPSRKMMKCPFQEGGEIILPGRLAPWWNSATGKLGRKVRAMVKFMPRLLRQSAGVNQEGRGHLQKTINRAFFSQKNQSFSNSQRRNTSKCNSKNSSCLLD